MSRSISSQITFETISALQVKHRRMAFFGYENLGYEYFQSIFLVLLKTNTNTWYSIQFKNTINIRANIAVNICSIQSNWFDIRTANKIMLFFI